jgi:hypothetical protein
MSELMARLISISSFALIAYATDDGAVPTLDMSSDQTDDFRLKVRGVIGLALQAAESHVH